MAAVIKDAGDDPDVTHHALVVARVGRSAPGSGITFHAGEGVGTVSRPGLDLAVGEPAINPVPRRMMSEAVTAVALEHGHSGDVQVEISIPEGRMLAERTMNGRLGIVGGLSVLGTTGVVVPYSCASWIASIRQGIDVARAAGLTHIAGATGKTSEAAVQRLYDLPDVALVDMGDFVGGMLKYLRRHPVPRVTVAGGFAKMTKLAAGDLDLHSGRSQVDLDWLAELVAGLGGGPDLIAAIRNSTSAGEVLKRLRDTDLPVADAIATRARNTASAVYAGEGEIEVAVFDRQGQLLGRAPA